MHFLRLIIQLDLPEDFQILDVVFREDLLILLPVGPFRTASIGRPVGSGQQSTTGEERHPKIQFSHKQSLSHL